MAWDSDKLAAMLEKGYRHLLRKEITPKSPIVPVFPIHVLTFSLSLLYGQRPDGYVLASAIRLISNGFTVMVAGLTHKNTMLPK